jgi:hypothetical protein
MSEVQRRAVLLPLILLMDFRYLKGEDEESPINQFGMAYNKWVKVANERYAKGGTFALDAREMPLWEQTKKEWNTLRKEIDAAYDHAYRRQVRTA